MWRQQRWLRHEDHKYMYSYANLLQHKYISDIEVEITSRTSDEVTHLCLILGQSHL